MERQSWRGESQDDQPVSADGGYLTPQDDLLRQRQLVEAWLQTGEAQRYADRIISRRPGNRSGGELLSETWLRVQSSFARRTEPYPDLWEPTQISRFMGRTMDNLSRDMVRTAIKRNEAELVDSLGDVNEATGRVDNRLLLEQLAFAVGRRAMHADDCPGCQRAVVTAAALEVVHLVLTEHDGSESGTTYLDRLIYEALDRVGAGRTNSDAARRQRKARCGQCVSALLEDGLRDIGVAA